MAQAPRDQNRIPALLGTSNVDGVTPIAIYADPVTHRLLVDTPGSMGSVTDVSVVTANGFAGSVATSTTTPAITISTTITGLLKGNGTAISAAVANTDYQSPITLTTTGTSGAATFNGTTLNIPQYTGGGGTVTSVSGTTDRITSTGGATPVIDIAATYVGQTSITTLGTVGTGVWNGTLVAGQYGGTGVANTGKTITVSGNTTIGSSTHTVAFATSGNTSITFPTSGTIATTTDIANMVTASATFATDESILRSDGTSRGAQASSTNATLTDAGAMTLASSSTAASFIPTSGTIPTLGMYASAMGVIGWSVSSALEMQLTTTALSPGADGGSSLGTTALGWQNLFANTGFVLNIEGGNWVATHTSGILTVGTGDLRVTTAGTNTASVVTVGGSQTLTSKTLTAPVISTISNTGTLTLPTSTDTLVGRVTTDTLTNKRNQPRTDSSTTASTLTPDLSVANVWYRTTQTATLTINAPTGTPVIGETIAIYVDSAGAQTLTINPTYKAFGAAFPASLTAGKTFMLTAQFNGTDWKALWSNAI